MNFNLSPNTTYYWRVASHCPNDEYRSLLLSSSIQDGQCNGAFLESTSHDRPSQRSSAILPAGHVLLGQRSRCNSLASSNLRFIG